MIMYILTSDIINNNGKLELRVDLHKSQLFFPTNSKKRYDFLQMPHSVYPLINDRIN